MGTFTPKWALPYPVSTDTADVPRDMQALALALDKIAFDDQGAIGSRPTSTTASPGKSGRMYTDNVTKETWRDHGTGWRRLGLPPGIVLDDAGTPNPEGFETCNAQAVSRTDPKYAPLFSRVGVIYGAGDGSTTYNLPDAQGRAVVGAGTGLGLTARALGAKGGEENHQLTPFEMPNHTHTVSDPGHTHVINNGGFNFIVSQLNLVAFVEGSGGNFVFQAGNFSTSVGNAGAFTGISLGFTGNNGAHNNMQPFIIFRKIISL